MSHRPVLLTFLDHSVPKERQKHIHASHRWDTWKSEIAFANFCWFSAVLLLPPLPEVWRNPYLHNPDDMKLIRLLAGFMLENGLLF